MMLTDRIPKKKRGQALKPVLPLIQEQPPKLEDNKQKFISIELKARAGAPATSSTYKKFVKRFEEGTPQEWIDLIRDYNEIWTQNSIGGGVDRASTVRSTVRGETLTAFETALDEARRDAEGNEQAVTPEMVDAALEQVAKTVFPHRALEIQKLWMQRGMKKPFALSTRKTAAAINRINNALPLFPGGDENSKFSEVELVGLLEWSLPESWRAKFDLDGYVPTLHPKARLIEACEAIERNQAEEKEQNTKSNKSENKKKKSGKSPKSERNSNKNYYCTEHGRNATHATSDCWTLQNKEKKKSNGTPPNRDKKFSNKQFRKELNLLAKGSSKKKVLELYSNVIKKEQAKLTRSEKRKAKTQEDDTDSSSDESVQVIEAPKRVKFSLNKIKKANAGTEKVSLKIPDSVKTDEEIAYLEKVKWLADHGDSDKDHDMGDSEESSDKSVE